MHIRIFGLSCWSSPELTYLFLFTLASLFLVSCEEEEYPDTVVLTEQKLYLSAEVARLSGRVVSSGGSIDDHGFFISESETFNNKQIVSLGNKEGVGRFIGEVNDLKPRTGYFARAFALVKGQTFEGNTVFVKTLTSSILNFSPLFGEGGGELIINGSNFTKETKVFFGGVETEIEDIKFESQIKLKVPPITNDPTPFIKVVVGDTTMTFTTPYEYVVGKWSHESSFVDTNVITEAVSITHQNQFIFGLGKNANEENNPFIWSYNLDMGIWSELAVFDNSETTRAPFSVGNFFGGGGFSLGLTPVFRNSFWQYQNDALQKVGELPFQLRNAIGVKINDQLYVFGGQDISGASRKMYSYDINNNIWQQLTDIPFEADVSYGHFVYKSNIYVVDHFTGDLWEYDYTLRKWSRLIKMPVPVDKNGIYHVVGDKLFFGLFPLKSHLWRLDMETLELRPFNRYPASGGDLTIASFTYGSKIYVLRRKFSSSEEILPMELWSFDPSDF
ncbi:IPT/TIG domain protein [Fulvivirga imtechensis AK7]|uniref:IPT/TIG domain protein n=1 Tax=Fulvivirga imtechensis AK7 TaxID=1237149 RepID=L8JKU9_9BACT|nr:kelch repeat-containing protein [Fulvivirga imtechensis]ELR69420.1 IPT/TIG domain protein [Fulvivirga imtechensis AK7]